MCDARLYDGPLVCQRTDPHDRGHVYASSTASYMGEGARHLEPESDAQ